MEVSKSGFSDFTGIFFTMQTPSNLTSNLQAHGAAGGADFGGSEFDFIASAMPPWSNRGGNSPAFHNAENIGDVGAKIDWLTVTWLPEPDEHVFAAVHNLLLDNLRGGKVAFQIGTGLFGYQHGAKFSIALNDGQSHHVARLDWGGTHHKMRARLDLSGSACGMVTSWPSISQWVSEQFDYKLTRVDLAVDCLDGEFSVDDAKDWYLSGEFHAGGRQPRHSTPGDWFKPHYGRTLEIGRRTNGKMLRAYEKGRQLGDSESKWTRFEVELRNIDRDLPLEILTDRDRYFTGAYKCLERILDAAALRVKTHQKEGEISLEKLMTHCREAYGRLVHTVRLTLSADEVIEQISRVGTPRRLEKATLHGFQPSGPPPA